MSRAARRRAALPPLPLLLPLLLLLLALSPAAAEDPPDGTATTPSPFDAIPALLDRDDPSGALRSFHRDRDTLLRRGIGFSPDGAERLFRAALSRPEAAETLLSFADRLDPDPRRRLALAQHRFAQGDPLDAAAELGRFLRQASGAPWNTLLFHLLFLAALSAALAASVRIFARLYLFRRALRHEQSETGVPFHRLDPDRLARLPDRAAKNGLYLSAACLVLTLFPLLSVSVGPAERLKRGLGLARHLFASEPGALPLERLLSVAALPEGTEATLAGFEHLRLGDLTRARDAFGLVEHGSPPHLAAQYGSACAEHMSGSHETALRRLLPLAANRDSDDLLLAAYTCAQAAGNKPAAAALRARLERLPGGLDRLVDISLVYLGMGGIPPMPLAGDGAALRHGTATRPGARALALALLGILSGLAALRFARTVFEPEPGDLLIRICDDCGRISCERCRATVGLCPRCLTALPPKLDPDLLRARQAPRDGLPSLLLSTLLFGFAAHLSGRHRLAAALAFSGYLSLFLARSVEGLLVPGASPETGALLSALAGNLFLLFLMLWFAQFAAGRAAAVAKAKG